MNVSIITVSFNSRATITDTIESIHRQSFDAIEHVIIDGGSSDGTVPLVESEIRSGDHFLTEVDDGIYDAMNKGIDLASGDIIGILNSDDFYVSNQVVERVVEVFEETGCDAVYGNIEFVDQFQKEKVIRTWKSSPYKAGSFRRGWHPPHPSFFVKRKVYERYGLFDLSLRIAADFELMLRFLERYQIKAEFLDKILVRMRYGGESTKSIKNSIIGNREVMRAFQKNYIPVSPLLPALRLMRKLKQFFFR